MAATAWDIELGSEFGEPFTIHGIGVTHGNSMGGYGIVDRLRVDLAALLAARRPVVVEAIYDRAGFASDPHAEIRPDNLAARFVDHIIVGLREDDFAPLLDWVRDLHQISDRRLLVELDIPRMLDAGCALVVSAAASIRDEITDIVLFFAELRQQLQGAYVRATIRPVESLASRGAKGRQQCPAEGRSKRLAVEIAEELGLGEEACGFMERVGQVHAVEAASVPAALLGNQPPLTKTELEIVAGHASIGATALTRIEALRAIAAIELHRDERWDGAGCPGGLAGPQIPLASRILAVVDAYDAMVAERISPENAVAALEAEAGRRWDPEVVAAATRLLRE
ncbi:MAG TPA: HD domain-containing phosphohydrolase [Candidatus Dormibacteraeota bacterium]|nr:HD domain-containing phosphohydrolase [Candidatus Dormibacteraeota bacterium]